MTAEIAPAWYIKTRAEFIEVLARTLKVAERLSASGPFWAHDSIAAQLQAMTDWTAGGRTPTPEESDRITIGLIAIREFDAEPVDEEADFINCLLQLAGYFEEWPDDPPTAPDHRPVDDLSPGLQLLLQRRISLTASAVNLAPGATTRSSLRAALSANAEHVRLPGLPTELNPLVLDVARVEAFIEGLLRQSEKVLRRLEGRWLALGVDELHLSTSSPVEAEAIAGGFELIVADDEGTVAQVQMRVPLRQAYAQDVAGRAKAALSEFEAEVAALEASGAVPFVLMQAKWRRFAAALVWRGANRCLAKTSRKFRAELKDASKAVARYVAPPWAALPPR